MAPPRNPAPDGDSARPPARGPTAAPRRATIYASVFGKADDVPVQSLVYDQDFGIPAVAVAVQGSDILLERPSGWRWRRKYTRLRLATVREKRQFAAVRKLHKQASAHAKPR